MDDKILRVLLMQQKKKYIQLSEVMDITVQLAEALERDDQVAVSMLIAMRQEPLLIIDEIQKVIGERLESLPDDMAAHLRKLLCGRGDEKPAPDELELDEQCQKDFRLLNRIIAIDKRLNQKVGKENSFYKD